MFKTAVIGVIAPFFQGVARSCVECHAANPTTGTCGGFGPGCLVAPRERREAETDPREARPTLRNL